MKVLVAQSCLTICNPMDYSLPGSSVHGILQARMLEWVAIPFSRGSSRPSRSPELWVDSLPFESPGKYAPTVCSAPYMHCPCPGCSEVGIIIFTSLDEEAETPRGDETCLGHQAQLDRTQGLGGSWEGWRARACHSVLPPRVNLFAVGMSEDEAAQAPGPSLWEQDQQVRGCVSHGAQLRRG